MSAQLFELLILGGIAFLVISKLISTLGTTNEKDGDKEQSFFGESKGIKDVTSSVQKDNIVYIHNYEAKADKEFSPEFMVAENAKDISAGISKIQSNISSFNPLSFIRNAKKAFRMIIEAGINQDQQALTDLVDKRYLERFSAIVQSYVNFSSSVEPTARISEVYMFGNNAFIKVIFNAAVEATKSLNEEWTFSRSLITPSPNWYLNNIEKLD